MRSVLPDSRDLVPACRTSAFSGESRVGTHVEQNIHEAEVALIHATLILVLVLNSQSEVFSLDLDAETKRSHECAESESIPSGRGTSPQAELFFAFCIQCFLLPTLPLDT